MEFIHWTQNNPCYGVYLPEELELMRRARKSFPAVGYGPVGNVRIYCIAFEEAELLVQEARARNSFREFDPPCASWLGKLKSPKTHRVTFTFLWRNPACFPVDYDQGPYDTGISVALRNELLGNTSA